MNSRQAKELLALYRPGTADRDDPEFAEALALVARDPALARWFENHCALQEALRAKFQQIPVPEGLQEQILSERKAHTTISSSRRAALVAAAAVVICLIGGMIYFATQPRENKTLSGFRYRMASLVLRDYPPMDLNTNDLAEIRHYLAQKGHGDYALTKALEATTGTGCALLSWQAKPVTMICFNSGRTATTNADLFLFVAARSDVPRAPAAGRAQLARVGGLSTAAWSAGDKVYLLGGLGDEEFLRKYF